MISPMVARLFFALFVSCLIVSPLHAEPPKTLDQLGPVLPDSVSLDSQVVYVDFWASWCAPCRQSFPWMKKLNSEYRDKGLRIVAVSVDKDHFAAQRFLSLEEVDFVTLFDSLGNLAEKYDLQSMPTSFVYDRAGVLRSTHQGFHVDDTTTLDSIIVSLLKEDIGK